jgi:hypothetical protein
MIGIAGNSRPHLDTPVDALEIAKVRLIGGVFAIGFVKSNLIELGYSSLIGHSRS